MKEVHPTLPALQDFSIIFEGEDVSLFFIENKNIKVALTNYGARVVSIIVPNKNGFFTDVVCGPGTIADFLNSDNAYFGATIGRYANRIANGTFAINDVTYKLALNNGKNHLHGGNGGLQQKIWKARLLHSAAVEFTYTSVDKEDGYPGNVKIKITYTVTANGALKILYEASTDKDTIINLTNHTYFNLNGCGSGKIVNHNLQIYADAFTPVTENLIPTGECRSVSNTFFDFRKPLLIGKRINETDEQLRFGNGYDHNFILQKEKVNEYTMAAEVMGDVSGVAMKVYTTEPGIQLYTGNFMEGKNTMKNNFRDDFRTAFCLETQHFPDSPNKPLFPSVLLKKGDIFTSATTYEFS